MRPLIFVLFLELASFHCTLSRTTGVPQVSTTFHSTQRPLTVLPVTLEANTPQRASDPVSKAFSASTDSALALAGNKHATTGTPVAKNGWNEWGINALSNISTDRVSFAEDENSFVWATDPSEYANSSEALESSSLGGSLFDYITIPMFGFACILGNTINIFVLISSPLRHISNTKILISLAISDSTFIFLFPFNKTFVRNLLGVDIRSISTVTCQVFFFFFRTSKMSSAWFVTLISIERFIAIWFPLKAKIINSKKTIQCEIILVILVLSTVNISWAIVGTGLKNGICIPHAAVEGYPNMKKEFVIYGITFVFLLPTMIMLVLSPLTVVRLLLNYRKRIRLTNSVKESNRKTSTNDTIRATIMLLSVTLAFVVLTGPITFGHIYTVFTDQSIFESMDGDMAIFRNLSQIMELMNFSINFFLYFGFSKSYRAYLLSCNRCGPKNGKMERSNTRTDITQTA